MKRELNSPEITSTPNKKIGRREIPDADNDSPYPCDIPTPNEKIERREDHDADNDSPHPSDISTPKKKIERKENHNANKDSPHPSVYLLASQTPLPKAPLSQFIDIKGVANDSFDNSLSDTLINLSENEQTEERNDDPNYIKGDMLCTIIKMLTELKQDVSTLHEENISMKMQLQVLTTENRALKTQIMEKIDYQTRRDTLPERNHSTTEDQMDVGNTTEERVPDRNHPVLTHDNQRPAPNIKRSAKKKKTPNDLKAKIEKEWGKTFHQRRVQYKREFLNNEKVKILEKDLNMKPIFLRRKYRPPYAKNEKHHKILENKSIQMVKADIEELKMYANEARERYIKCDEEMEELITYAYPNETERDQMLQLWEDEVTKSQPISRNLCFRNIQFLSNLHKTDPYKGYSSTNNSGDFRQGHRQ